MMLAPTSRVVLSSLDFPTPRPDPSVLVHQEKCSEWTMTGIKSATASLSLSISGAFTMIVGKKRFYAKSIERITKNFARWRDSGLANVNELGTHWEVRCAGILCGHVTYDGNFWPHNVIGMRPWKVVDEFMAETFAVLDSHSAEYRDGVRAALEWRLLRIPRHCPHPTGTAQADAYVAGFNFGERVGQPRTDKEGKS
jgi:hypothetical protein